MAVPKRRSRLACSWAGSGALTGSLAVIPSLVLCLVSAPQLLRWVAPLAFMTGASAGALGGLAGAGIAYSTGAGEWFALDIAIEEGLAWSASLGVGATVTEILIPGTRVVTGTLIGPAVIFMDKLGLICSGILAARIPVVSAAFRRFPLGRVVGIVLATFIIWLVMFVNRSPEVTRVFGIDLIFLRCLVFIGTSAALVGALGSSMHGASRKRAALFAIEASSVSVVATLGGAALTSLSHLLGIGFATAVAALWSATRGRHLHPRQQRC